MLFFQKKQAVSWLIVFLGNPGAKYDGTRHNAGFMAADAFCRERGIRIDRLKFHALTALWDAGGEKALLMKPQTFMNRSGDAVSEAQKFYKVPTDHIIVVSDDITLPLGKLRVRRSGSAGGHNGLKDIIAKCGGEGFPRVKMGVGAPPSPDYEVVDWVLSSFRNRDAEIMEETAKRAGDAVEDIVKNGADHAMNSYNG